MRAGRGRLCAADLPREVSVTARAMLLGLGLLCAAPVMALGMSGTAIAPTYYYAGYTPTVLNYAASKGGMLTQVMGNPFQQVDRDQLNSEINGVMARSHFGPRLPFISKAPADFASPYRVVLLFDPAQAITGYQLCTYDGRPAAANPGGTVRVHAALCANEKPLSSVSGEVGGVASPSDRAFKQLIGQMTVLLFPPRTNPGGHRNDSEFFS